MTSISMSNLPRPATTSSNLGKALPFIPHPRASVTMGLGVRGGDTPALSVCGQSRQGVDQGSDSTSPRVPANMRSMRREKSMVTMDKGRVITGLDRSNLPPLLPKYKSTYSMDYSKEPKQKIEEDVDLAWLIREKLESGVHGLKHQFKSHDPNGQGNVSREALLKIVYSLVGYISRERFHHLLQKLDLDDSAHISFDDFISGLTGQESNSKKEWMNPVNRLNLRNSWAGESSGQSSGQQASVSAALAFAILRHKARNREYRVQNVFPVSCFQPGGMVLQPHLINLLHELGVAMTEAEKNKLWQRFDVEAIGAVKTPAFLKVLGLTENGLPENYAASIVSSNKQTPQKCKRIPSPKWNKNSPRKLPPLEHDDLGEIKSPEAEIISEDENPKPIKHIMKPVRRRMPPELDNVIDRLLYKFEDGYQSLVSAIQCFDTVDDGYVSRTDLKQVLREFGMTVSATDLQYFLSRCNVRSRQGQVFYKELLNKFWNKSSGGMLNRIVTNGYHAFSQDFLPTDGTLSAEQLEARLVDFMHGPFLKMIGKLREADRHSLGVVKQYEFKNAIESTLGSQMTSSQWEGLKEAVQPDDDGLMPYPKFLQTFSCSVGSWNRQKVGLLNIPKVTRPETPSEQLINLKGRAGENHKRLEELEEKVKQEEHERRMKPRRRLVQGRPLQHLYDMMLDVFNDKFYLFDQAFKASDRKMTSRISSRQFYDVLKEIQVELSMGEVESLWSSIQAVGQDNLIQYVALIQHFRTPHQISEQAPSKGMNLDPLEEAKKKQEERKKRERELAEQAKQEIIKLSKPTVRHISHGEKKDLLNRIRPKVVQHWDHLKSLLRDKDKIGSAKVYRAEIQEMLLSINVAISDDELFALLQCYDLHGDGKCHYIEFLKNFTESAMQNDSYIVQQSEENRLRAKVPSARIHDYRGTTRLTLTQVLTKHRKQLLKDYRNLRRSFMKRDTAGEGYLSVNDLLKCLQDSGVQVTQNDLQVLTAHFDTTLKGRVSYKDFINKLITV